MLCYLLETCESELDDREKVHNEKIHDELLGPDPLEEMKPNALFSVKSVTIAVPKFNPDFNLVAKNVTHFYVGFPAFNGEHQSTVQPMCLISRSVIMVKLLNRSIGSEYSK